MGPLFFLLGLVGLIDARFDHLHPSFTQVFSKLSAGEPVSPDLLATRAAEWKRLYKLQPEEAFRVADLTQSLTALLGAGIEFALSGVGTVTTTCGTRQIPVEHLHRNVSKPLKPIIWSPFENPGDRCYQAVAIGDITYMLRLSLQHPLRVAGEFLMDIPLHGYVIRSTVGGSPEFFPRTTPFHPLAIKEDGEIGLHMGHEVLKFETLEHRGAYLADLNPDTEWSAEVLKTKRRLSTPTCSPTSSPPVTTSVPFVELGTTRRMCAVRYILTDGLPVKDSSGADITDAIIQNQMTKIREYYIQNSYNAFTFSVPVQIYTVTGTVQPGVVDYNQMLRDWRTANPGVWCLCDAEYILFNYGMGGYNVPGWAGLATLNTQGGWLNGDVTPRVWAHELGHNVGFGHSRQYQLNAPSSTWQGAGVVYEYGDPYDLMGGGTVDMTDGSLVENDVAYFGTLYRSFIQNTPWISAAQVTQIGQTISGGALDITLFPCDMGLLTPALTGNSKLAVHYLRPAEISQVMTTAGTVGGGTSTETIKFGRFLFEYKTKLKSVAAKQGLIVHGAAISGTSFGIMLDNNPQTTSTADSPLSFGNTFSDCAYGVHVTGEKMDCPGAVAGSMGCARAMLRNGQGGVNIGLVVTDTATSGTSSTTTVGGTITLSAALSDIGSKTVSVYWDWGDGTISKGLSASHSWATMGLKVVTVTATSLESAYTKVLYKVQVGTGLNIAKLITTDTLIDSDTQGKTFGTLAIDSTRTGFTIAMMVKFTNVAQNNWHDMWALGGWTFVAKQTSGSTYGYYFIQTQTSASGGPAPFFNKVAQAAIVVEKTGSTATATVYIDGAAYYTKAGLATAWPTLTSTIKVGAMSTGQFIGGVVSQFRVYNWALSATDLALDATGADLLNMAQVSGGTTSGCTTAPPTTPSSPSAPSTPTSAPSVAPTSLKPTTLAPSLAPSRAPTFAGCVVPASFPAGYVSGGAPPCTTSQTLAHLASCNIACSAGLTTGLGTTAYSCNNGVRTDPTLSCVGSAPSQVLITTPTATGFTVSAVANAGPILRVNIDNITNAPSLTTQAGFWSVTGPRTSQATATGATQTFAFTGLVTGNRYCAMAASAPSGTVAGSSALVASAPACIVVGLRCTLPTTGAQPGWDQTACPLGSVVDNTYSCTISCLAPYTARTGTTQYICNNGALTVPSLTCGTNAPTPLPTTSRPTLPPSTPVAPTCFDAIQNGNELGVDCGGPDCGPCACGVVVVEESNPTSTPRPFFGTYLNTGTTTNSRPVYQHVTSKLYLYSQFVTPDTYWLIGMATNGSNFEAYTLSVASTAQSIPPGGWKLGSSFTGGLSLTELSTKCQTFNGTSECGRVRFDGRVGTGSYVNGIWLNQNTSYGGHPTYKHSSLPRFLYWSSNGWNIADAVASSSVIAKRASHALNTYIPFTQGYSFDQPWQFLSGGSFVPDSMVTSWCLGCIGVNVNSVALLAQATYFGNHETYQAVGNANMLAFTHGGWAYVPTNFAGYALPAASFVRAPLASSPHLITTAFSPALTTVFCTVPATTPTTSDACFDLSCQTCITNPLCKFCAAGSNVGQQRCLSSGIACSGTTTTAGNCPNVNDIPRSCGPLVSPQNAVPATCAGALGSVCTFSCATGYTASGSPMRTCQTLPATWDGVAMSCAPKSCPALSTPLGGVSVPSACSGKLEGDTCSFACNTGYVGTGAYTVTCTNGAWVGTPLTCAKIACPSISSGANAVPATCSGKVHGDSCVFSCSAGFIPANATLQCVAGTWVGSMAQCTATPCSTLYSPFGAPSAACAGKVSGDVCSFSCNAGTVAAGSASRTCTNGAWTGTALSCTAANACPSLVAPFPGSKSEACNGIAASGTCNHTCEAGYTQGGDSIRTCSASFTWGGSPLTCTPQSCPVLSSPPGAVTASCSGKVQGETCTFVCAAGYRANNNQGTRTCDNQVWAGSSLDCTLKVCPDLTSPANAVQASCTQTLDQGTCSFVCNMGYAPKTYSIFCLDGTWADIPPLQCAPNTCPDLLPPVGGTGAACTGKTHGTTCTFGCNAGLTANMYATRTCQDGVWSGQPFTCTSATACPALESPAGALSASCSAKVQGDSCSFTCASGYVIASGDNTRLCGTGQAWSGNMLQCAPKRCFDLQSPPNAILRTCANMTEGQTCLHQCDSESTPLGDAQRTCVNGGWSGVPLQCSGKVCPGLTAPLYSAQFGSSCQGYGSRSTCTFSCLPGYVTVGDPVRVCLQGAWRGNVLQCVEASTQYVWSGSSWGPCTASCGPATQSRQVDCVDLFNASMPVNSSVCTALGLHPAESIQTCANNPPCQDFNWIMGTWGMCTQACGGGQSERSVQCQATIGTGALATTSIVSDDMCNLGSKPLSVQTCNSQTCTSSTWSSTLWSSCSALCGGGTQSRVVTCLDSNLNNVADSNCSSAGAKPMSSQVCNSDLCLTFKWKVCPLDKCTAPCNGAGTGLGMIGYQYREIFCLRNTDSRRVDDSLCQATAKPTGFVEGCNGFPCTENYWMTTQWTACNASGANGEGTRTRTYHCHFADGRNGLFSDCPAAKAPTTTESCNINVCRGEAFTVAGPVEEPIISDENAMYIGIGVGALVAVLAAGGLIWWCARRQKGASSTRTTKKQLENEMASEYVPKAFNKTPAASPGPRGVGAPSSRPSPPAPPGRLPPGWEQMRDGNGDIYYENSGTGETSWDAPR